VLAGRPATVSSDIYSVGVLLYYLVSRAYPVEGRSLDEITSAHILGQRTPLGERRPDLPAPFRQIVDRAVAGRPEDRWPSASALFDALGRPGSNADVDRHPIARGAAIAAGAVIGLALTLTGLGAISSKFFNTFVLGRENFVNESVFEWMYWGALSLPAPLHRKSTRLNSSHVKNSY